MLQKVFTRLGNRRIFLQASDFAWFAVSKYIYRGLGIHVFAHDPLKTIGNIRGMIHFEGVKSLIQRIL